MKTLYKEFITRNDQEIQLSICFRSLNDCVHEKTGYIVSVTPIQRTKGEGYNIIEIGCFTGFNKLLYHTTRQHQAYLKRALIIYNKEKEELIQYLFDHFLNKEYATN